MEEPAQEQDQSTQSWERECEGQELEVDQILEDKNNSSTLWAPEAILNKWERY